MYVYIMYILCIYIYIVYSTLFNIVYRANLGMGKKRVEKGILITLAQPTKSTGEPGSHDNVNPIEFPQIIPNLCITTHQPSPSLHIHLPSSSSPPPSPSISISMASSVPDVNSFTKPISCRPTLDVANSCQTNGSPQFWLMKILKHCSG